MHQMHQIQKDPAHPDQAHHQVQPRHPHSQTVPRLTLNGWRPQHSLKMSIIRQSHLPHPLQMTILTKRNFVFFLAQLADSHLAEGGNYENYEWLAGIPDVDYSPESPITPTPLDDLDDYLDEEEILFPDSHLAEGGDHTDSEWLAATAGIPDIDIPPEAATEKGLQGFDSIEDLIEDLAHYPGEANLVSPTVANLEYTTGANPEDPVDVRVDISVEEPAEYHVVHPVEDLVGTVEVPAAVPAEFPAEDEDNALPTGATVSF
eukprot:Colp12_sorted_trinity150504_noHs@30119